MERNVFAIKNENRYFLVCITIAITHDNFVTMLRFANSLASLVR